jgi:hypothetical protein
VVHHPATGFATLSAAETPEPRRLRLNDRWCGVAWPFVRLILLPHLRPENDPGDVVDCRFKRFASERAWGVLQALTSDARDDPAEETMGVYRCYVFDQDSHIIAVENIDCADDQAARRCAQDLLEREGHLHAEVWEKARLVGRVEREARHAVNNHLSSRD